MSHLYFISFILALLLSLLLTPLVIKLAVKLGAIDKPDPRKVHKKITPRLGGLAVSVSVMISLGAMLFIFPQLYADAIAHFQQLAIVGFGVLLIVCLGVIDDINELKPGIKFAVQFLAAILIYIAGFKISNITNPLGAGVLNVELIDFPLTVLWIVGIMNAFNLIDGLDGLAAGIATIACISIFIVASVGGELWAAILAVTLAGSLIGFLKYNFNPASVFLGDTGSLFIGISLAILSIQSTTKISTGFAVLFPLLVLALPITDTIISMIRRLFASFLHDNNPAIKPSLVRRLYGMFSPDKSHIHHQLLSLGLSHRNTVVLLYAVSGIFAMGGFLLTRANTLEQSLAITGIFIFLLIAFIRKLKYHEIAIFNNGLMIPFYERWILNHRTLTTAADITFIVISFILSYTLVSSLLTVELAFFSTLILFLSVQFFVFFLNGLYKEEIKQFGIGNALHVVGTVGYSVLAVAFIISIINPVPLLKLVQFMVLNFYFLLTLVLGYRIAYHALSFLFNRDKQTGENVLIYGANENGTMLLHKINNSPNTIKVIGFLDDDPDLKDKMIYGYPILGGHWNLHKIASLNRINSIFICKDSIKSENLKRLKMIAEKNNISLKKLLVSFEDMPAHSSQSISHRTIKPSSSNISFI